MDNNDQNFKYVINYKQFRKYLVFHFGRDEIRIICFDLGLDYEEFSEKKSMLIVELLSWAKRNNKLYELIKWLEEEGFENFLAPALN